MTDSLRAKQNMEILDVFKDLHSQVMGLQNKQVQRFQESIKPKTQRDLGAEVNADKAIENMNRTLETKLGALEFVVQNISEDKHGVSASELTSASNKNVFYQSFNQANNTGDIIPLWNSIVRAYSASGVNRETQQVIKVKVLELEPNLDAMNFGLDRAIDKIYEFKIISPPTAGNILELMRTLSVFTEIASQVDSNPPRFEILNVELLERAFKNIFDAQSPDRLTIMKDYAPRDNLYASTLRNIPLSYLDSTDVMARIKAMEEELGIKMPQSDIDALKAIPKNELNKALDKIHREFIPEHQRKIAKSEYPKLRDIQELRNQWYDLQTEWGLIDAELGELTVEIEQLENDIPLEEDRVRDMMMELPEEPIEPDPVDIFDYVDAPRDAYLRAMEEYQRQYEVYQDANLQYQHAVAYNEFLYERTIEDLSERAEVIRHKNQQVRQLEGRKQEIEEEELPEIEESINILEEEFAEGSDVHDLLTESFISMLQRVDDKAMRKGNIDEVRRIESGRLRGEPVAKPKRESAKAKRERLAREAEDAEMFGNSDEEEAESSADSFGEFSESEVGSDLGFGKPVETRGQSTLRRHYGYKDVNPTRQLFDFDDRGNDSYTMKPAKR